MEETILILLEMLLFAYEKHAGDHHHFVADGTFTHFKLSGCSIIRCLFS
jgi:hypothetical protein